MYIFSLERMTFWYRYTKKIQNRACKLFQFKSEYAGISLRQSQMKFFILEIFLFLKKI